MYNPTILAAIGFEEILVILVVVLLLFGGKKIPELMKGLGQGIREFKDGQKGSE
jgi:sec-independent protein translocase protein TatA